MAYQALARKYRPQTFHDILGQEHVVRTLSNAIEQNRIHHAYLFSGVRGVGKTTAARILAKAINCVKGPTADPDNTCSICREITEGIDLDVREIDAATYTQVENIRELREVSQFQPARDRKRIFIIDEAHMLSMQSWNALLKLIEEPPPHVTFILATTEMQKVPATILSRVQSFIFRKITQKELAGRLAEICAEEGIEAEMSALEIIARRGEGSVRDSLSLLDQIIAFSGRSLSAADVSTVLGLSGSSMFGRLLLAIREGEHATILETLHEASESGRDFKLLYRDLLGFCRNLLLIVSGANDSLLTGDAADMAASRELAGEFDHSELLRIVNVLLKDDELITRSEQQRLAVEIALLKAATFPRLRSVENALRAGGNAGATETPRPRATASTPPPRRAAEAESVRSEASPVRRSEPETSGDTSPSVSSPSAGLDLPTLVARLRVQRRSTSSYVEQARSFRIDGNVFVLEFEDPESFAAGFLADADQLKLIGEIAGELAGRPLQARVGSANAAPAAAPRAEAGKAPGSEDPVLRSFATHLGGELIAPRRK